MKMTKQDLARFKVTALRQINAVLDHLVPTPRSVPLSARADIPQPKFDLMADQRASSPASRSRQF